VPFATGKMVVAVFTDGWTLEAAAEVAALKEDRALELTEALARHSLIYLDRTGTAPDPRLRMLETVRAFVAEGLNARPDVTEVRRRHADHYRQLVEQADRPPRGVGHSEWLERLEVEAGNLAAAVEWYLAHDPGPLPHLFRVLWPFWFLRERIGEARAWVDELLPTVDALDPHARAELLWTALATALEVGDDSAALAARDRLAPMLEGIQDSYLHALSDLAMAWTSPIVGDFDGALRQASVSLEEFRSQDEPFGMVLAVGAAAGLETVVGRYDEALGHLRKGRDLEERFDNAWLATYSRVQLGILAVAQGRLVEARAQLDEALDLSMAARSTRSVTLCLAAFAQLALAAGDPERAALLAGAAEGLRRRVGLRTWPTLRHGEAELVAQLRQALGANHFEAVHAAGARLNQRQAVAAVPDRLGASVTAP
jgi:tetratricopeptide (TPR) repeat protein